MIELTQILTKDDFRTAAFVHYRTYPMPLVRPWLAVCLIGIGILLIAGSTQSAFGFLAVAYGIYMLLRRRLWANRIMKSAATAKLFGEAIRVELDSNGFIHTIQGDNSTQLNMATLFGFVRHEIGFLLYPQRNIFFYLKATAFESKAQMDAMQELLRKLGVKQIKA